MQCNSTRPEKFLHLRLHHTFTQHNTRALSLSATYLQLGSDPSAPGTWDQIAKGRPQLQGPLPASGCPAARQGCFAPGTQEQLPQPRVNVAMPRMPEDEGI